MESFGILKENMVKFILLCCMLFSFGMSCNIKYSDDECFGAVSEDRSIINDIGPLTDSSLLLFPNNLPTSISFKSSFNQLNLLEKNNLKSGKYTWTYHTEIKKVPCAEIREFYKKSVSHESIDFIPISQPNFFHTYSRTRYIEYQDYLNLNAAVKLDTTFEIVTVTLKAPYKSYSFIVPLGDVGKLLTNYTYFDSLTFSGISFNNIYHIYADSANYDINKIAPQGLYYNPNEGLVGYYLSNGELWVKQ
jgi:hypothetical protein